MKIRRTNEVEFICVGAEKSGTTWLADVLREHPDIYLPKEKELHYFNQKFVEDMQIDNLNNTKPLKWYLSFFKNADDNQLKGEITPSYLWDKKAAKNISQETEKY